LLPESIAIPACNSFSAERVHAPPPGLVAYWSDWSAQALLAWVDVPVSVPPLVFSRPPK